MTDLDGDDNDDGDDDHDGKSFIFNQFIKTYK